jgi:hypothetical protein
MEHAPRNVYKVGALTYTKASLVMLFGRLLWVASIIS